MRVVGCDQGLFDKLNRDLTDHHLVFLPWGAETVRQIHAEAPEVVCVQCYVSDWNRAHRFCEGVVALMGKRAPAFLFVLERICKDRVLGFADFNPSDFVRVPWDPKGLVTRIELLKRQRSLKLQTSRLIEELTKNAQRDPLTHLYNREILDDETVKSYAQSGTAMLMIDVDHFKRVNDTYGHLVGDGVLVEFSRRLEQNLRSGDLLCRYGGDEFLALLSGTSIESANSVAEKLAKVIANQPFSVGGHEMTVTASIGVGTFGALKEADRALYQAKKQGRNCVKMV